MNLDYGLLRNLHTHEGLTVLKYINGNVLVRDKNGDVYFPTKEGFKAWIMLLGYKIY